MDVLEQVQRRAKDMIKDLESGASVIWGEAERAETAQPGEEQGQGTIVSVYKYLMGWQKNMEPDTSQWWPVNRQEAMGTKWSTRNSI